MDRNIIPKEFRTQKCLDNLYTPPNSSKILQEIEDNLAYRLKLKQITS